MAVSCARMCENGTPSRLPHSPRLAKHCIKLTPLYGSAYRIEGAKEDGGAARRRGGRARLRGCAPEGGGSLGAADGLFEARVAVGGAAGARPRRPPRAARARGLR